MKFLDPILEQLFPFQGLILLDVNLSIIQSNTKARKLCCILQEHSESDAPCQNGNKSTESVPQKVKNLCKLLIESYSKMPNAPRQLYDNIPLNDFTRLYLEARWMYLGDPPLRHILVMLQDLNQIAYHQAKCDAYRYQLTKREMEVWKLRLQGLSYQEVSKALFISTNTVKKHMKSIHAKSDDCSSGYLTY
ncbi:MAG: hypothetical protein F6K11_20705 [Leptolyngbya sp. SIO3F4]|nr:hypothetical protein [Leptolyngbya sp. SIO3F4]